MQNFFLFTVIQYVKDHIFSRKPTYKKKAGLQSCCSANRGSGIAFVTNSNTVAHAVYIIKVRARMRAQ